VTELQRMGPQLVGMQLHNQVAILWSRDSMNALNFMPFTSSGPQWSFAPPIADYGSLVRQFDNALYTLNTGADFVFPETTDFSQYKLLIVPELYIADEVLLQRIADYVKGANENSAVLGARAGAAAGGCRIQLPRGRLYEVSHRVNVFPCLQPY